MKISKGKVKIIGFILSFLGCFFLAPDALAVTTYDINSTNSDAWEYYGTSIPIPTSGSWVAASAGDKTDIGTDDSSRWETKLTTDHDQFDYQLYRYDVVESVGSITDLTATWKGYGEAQTNYDVFLYIWNFNSVSWEQLDTNHFSSDGTLTGSKTSSISDYIDGSGYAYLATSAKHYNYAPPAPASMSAYEGTWAAVTSWPSVTDPESDTVQYYAEVIGTGLSSGWQSGTSWTSSANLACETWYTARVKARDTYANAESSWTNSAAFYTSACGGSCPYLYIWDGEKYVFKTDLYGSGGLAYKRGPKPLRPLPHRIYQVESVIPIDGKINFKIFEDLNEIDYFDRVQLLSYLVPENSTFGINIPPFNGNPNLPLIIHTISADNLMKPVSAFRLDTNENVVDLISEVDDKKMMFSSDSNNYSYTTFEIDFGDISNYPQKKLVITGETVFPKTKDRY